MTTKKLTNKEVLRLKDFVKGRYGKFILEDCFTVESVDENIPTKLGEQYLQEMNDFHSYVTSGFPK